MMFMLSTAISLISEPLDLSEFFIGLLTETLRGELGYVIDLIIAGCMGIRLFDCLF